MSDFNIRAGNIDNTIYVRLRDSTTGLAKTGLVFNSTGAVCRYVLPRAASLGITLVTVAVAAAHTDGGFIEVDATNNKGLYRLDLPDAAVASGNYSTISIEFDGVIEESITIPLKNSVDLISILGTALTETPGYLAAGFKKFFDVETPTGSLNSLPEFLPGDNGGLFRAGTNAATTITGALTTTFTGTVTGTVGGIAGTITTLDALDTQQDLRHGETITQGNSAWATVTGHATAAELAKVPKSDGIVTWNATALASIETQVDDGFATYAPATAAALTLAQADLDIITDSDGIIIGAAAVDLIWNEPQAGHVTAGTFGLYLDAAISGIAGGSGLTAQQTRDAMMLAPVVGSPAAGSVDTLITTVDTVVDNIQVDLDNTTDGLGALKLLIDAVGVSAQAALYPKGAVWFDSVNGSAGAVDYTNGIVTAPSSDWTNAQTIATSLKLSSFEILPGSTVTLSPAIDNRHLRGTDWILALNFQDIGSCHFDGAVVSGTALGSGAEFHNCELGTMSSEGATFINCSIAGTITLSTVATYKFIGCYAGSAGVFADNSATITEILQWNGPITFSNLGSGSTVVISGQMGVIDLGTPAGATAVEIIGTYGSIINAGSAVIDLTAAVLASDVAAILVDSDDLQTNQSAWTTAVGFSTHAPTAIVSGGAITTSGGTVSSAVLADSASHGGAATVINFDHIIGNSTTEHVVSLLTSAASKYGFTSTATGTNGIGFKAHGAEHGVVFSNDSASTGDALRLSANGSGSGLTALSNTGTALNSATTDLIVATIKAGIAEGSLDLEEMLRIILAATAGKSNSHETNAPKYRNQADTLDRISATTDANGNRTATTVNGA
tara:strand:+ start:2316 stop:4838 length:2523 start_codon:yes stop_codon:yes gene_type:complete